MRHPLCGRAATHRCILDRKTAAKKVAERIRKCARTGIDGAVKRREWSSEARRNLDCERASVGEGIGLNVDFEGTGALSRRHVRGAIPWRELAIGLGQ